MSIAPLAKLRRPRGLAARAVIFVTSLMLITAVLAAGIVLYGAHRESERRQVEIARDVTGHFAVQAGDMLAHGRADMLERMFVGAVTRTDVLAISARDHEGRLIAQAGIDANTPQFARIAAEAARERRMLDERTPQGLNVAAPIVREGRLVGVIVRAWSNDAYRFQAMPALTPFLLILAIVGLAALALTAMFVRRAVAPLDELIRFAESAGQGQTAPLDIRTGDEFETLAKAFNDMMGRIDASMRRIQEIAFVDPATQLPNQDRFVREVDYAILQGKSQCSAVAIFELQRLPKLMQTLDPDAARDFLRVVAEKLSSAARTVESLVRVSSRGDSNVLVARLGAVEFGVFAPALASASDAARFAQHLNAALNQPFEWRGHKFTFGACCGLALAPRDGRDGDTVIRHARMALGAATAAPGKLKVYTNSLDREAVARLTLEREMRGALDDNQFRAFFQPKINLATGKIGACEALARWVRPDRTIISPGRFIPVAEESGLIGQLSDAIMREACWKAAAWARAGHATNVSVNVSALQFRSERFADNVLRIVQHAGLAPNLLELEITESVIMEDPDRALRLIEPLRKAGVRLAIDDFGCGYSSLAALSRLPFDVIKIDQQFVRALERGDREGEAIIEMILALAEKLKLEIVAEGVERREEVEFMAQRGCHWVQGFFYGAAVSAPEFAELLRRQAGEEVVSADAA